MISFAEVISVSRLDLLNALSTFGPATVAELAHRSGLSDSSVRTSMGALEGAGLVVRYHPDEDAARALVFEIEPERVRSAFEFELERCGVAGAVLSS